MAEENTPLDETSLGGMSDADIENLDLGFLSQDQDEAGAPDEGASAAESGEQEDEEQEPGTDEDPSGEADDGGEEDAGSQEEDGEEEADGGGEESPDGGEEPDSDADADTEQDGDGEDSEKDSSEKETDEVDYKAIYEKIFAPFKANGKEIKIDSVDDAVQLMQMGANYNKKMAALKPNLKTLKLLENNKLLDPEKLSYLIDLDQKNPEAIRKLIKDSGIDPLDIDTEKESEYTPKTHTVDDREIELDSVLDDIQDSPQYSRVVRTVNTEWDADSKQAVYTEPQLLKVINDHMASGVYDRISTELEKERTLGRLNGVSFIQAYKQVGDALNAKGAFNDLFQEQTPEKPAPKEKIVTGKQRAADPKRKSKKRAAGSPRKAPADSKPDPDFNPLGMSDAEFAKLINEDLM